MKKRIICPRCGNAEIALEHNYCMICSLPLKENVPAGAATPKSGTKNFLHQQDTPDWGSGQEARCQKCGRPMAWTGKVWLTCEHCQQLQQWPTGGTNHDGIL